jgi:exopolysaccharide production protein ExoY
MFDADSEFSLQSTAATVQVQPQWLLYRDFGKRAFDLAFVVMLSPLLFPVIALLALAVRLDGGAAFFGHKRVGKDGKTFKCWKLRSMVPDAEQRLRTYLLENKEEQEFWQANFKLANDPRITKLGRFLRKTSLDELPQFWNVLIGDMSVVGPRPVTLEETALYGNAKAVLQTVRPGITGLWQVSGRNAVDYDHRITLDVKYLSVLDFPADIGIILRTVFVMLKRTGV